MASVRHGLAKYGAEKYLQAAEYEITLRNLIGELKPLSCVWWCSCYAVYRCLGTERCRSVENSTPEICLRALPYQLEVDHLTGSGARNLQSTRMEQTPLTAGHTHPFPSMIVRKLTHSTRYHQLSYFHRYRSYHCRYSACKSW